MAVLNAAWSKAPLAVALAYALASAGCSSHHTKPDSGELDAAALDAAAIDAHAPDAPSPVPKDAEVDAAVDAGFAADSGPLDAGAPITGPRGSAFTAAGGRSGSSRFTVFSTTGQPTPVSKGRMKSPNYSVSPGILGGK